MRVFEYLKYFLFDRAYLILLNFTPFFLRFRADRRFAVPASEEARICQHLVQFRFRPLSTQQVNTKHGQIIALANTAFCSVYNKSYIDNFFYTSYIDIFVSTSYIDNCVNTRNIDNFFNASYNVNVPISSVKLFGYSKTICIAYFLFVRAYQLFARFEYQITIVTLY